MPRDHSGDRPRSASAKLRSTASRAGSPWESKKRRKVNTCTECRRRKLQCDQATPTCGRCIRAIQAGQPAVCRYSDDILPSPLHQHSPTDASGTDVSGADMAQPPEVTCDTDSAQPTTDVCEAVEMKLDRQNRRIEELERTLNRVTQNLGMLAQNQTNPLTPESCQSAAQLGNTVSDPEQDPESTLLKGNSFKTRFYGLSFPESIMAYTPKLSDLSKEIVGKFPILLKVRQDLREYGARSSERALAHEAIARTNLLSLLPAQTEAETIVRLYLENYDTIYHIIHLPSFRSESAKMWSNLSTSNPYFVALILLMIATAQCLQNNGWRQYAAKRSAARDAAIRIIEACEEWLMLQAQKPTTILDFQIRFLLCLSKTVNGTKFKRAWVDIGTLLRYCMAAGLHRDPESLSRAKPTSALDKEMRRRIWFAVTELELQTSFTRGMMSATWLSCSDCTAPRNFPDDEITRHSSATPPSRDVREFCESSYLVVANASFPLRYSLNSVLNDVRQTITFDMVKYYTEQIERHLMSIPQWNQKTAYAPQALLCLCLCNYMLVLHDRHLRQANSEMEQKFSKLVIVDTVPRISEVHRILQNVDCHAIQLLCQDHLRAVLSTCHAITGVRQCLGSRIDQTLLETAVGIAHSTVELLEERVERLGGGQQQLWIALVANALIKNESEPGDKGVHMQEAVDKMIGSYYKILACQEVQPLTATTLPDLSLASELNDRLPSAQRFTPFDVDAMAAWTFDEWSFDPGSLDFSAHE